MNRKEPNAKEDRKSGPEEAETAKTMAKGKGKQREATEGQMKHNLRPHPPTTKVKSHQGSTHAEEEYPDSKHQARALPK